MLPVTVPPTLPPFSLFLILPLHPQAPASSTTPSIPTLDGWTAKHRPCHADWGQIASLSPFLSLPMWTSLSPPAVALILWATEDLTARHASSSTPDT